MATTVCSPADVVKTRIMNSKGSTGGGSGGDGVSGNAILILKNAVKHEGIDLCLEVGYLHLLDWDLIQL